jgi:hypothetical protein
MKDITAVYERLPALLMAPSRSGLHSAAHSGQPIGPHAPGKNSPGAAACVHQFS